MNRLSLRPVLFMGIILILSACSNSPPEILQNFWEITLVESPDSTEELVTFREELSIFTVSRDDDGDDEIESVFLIQDEEELFWELDKDNWEEIELQGEKWIGGSSLLMMEDEPFPRSSYRLLVIDRSGQRDETSIAISIKRVLDPLVFPRLSRNGDDWEIQSPYDQHIIRLYNGDSILKGQIKIDNKNFTQRFLREQLKPSSGDVLVLSAQDVSKGWVLQSLPFQY
ncbi:MAG: hypothetical protein JEY99_14545 [Spirochaetales bacterium]|nr:hypothetical protein [Spirochaetales bacterium]